LRINHVIFCYARSPFNGKQAFQTIRDKMVNLCHELSVTMQQVQHKQAFVD